MKKIIGLFFLTFILISCVVNEDNKIEIKEKENIKLEEGLNIISIEQEKNNKEVENTNEDSKNLGLKKIREIVEKNTLNIGTDIPELSIISEEKKKIISQLELNYKIIENIKIEKINFQFFKNSEIHYNKNKSLGLYTICTGDKNKSWTEKRYCGLLEYDFLTKRNKVIFLGHGGWHGGPKFIPKFRYNYDNDIIYNNNYYYPRKYIGNLIDNKSSNNFALDKNDINIYSGWTNKYNLMPNTYTLSGSYIGVFCYLDCRISYEKNITYNTSKNYMSNQWIKQDIYIPYYNLKKDFDNLRNSNGYTKFINNISENINKNDIDYINLLKEDEFDINLSFENVNPTLLSKEEYNDNNYYTWSGSIFKIKGINPKTVKFNFYENKNVEHPYLRIIGINSNKYNGLFIYNINNVKFSWLDIDGIFEGWNSEYELIISGKKIDLNNEEFKETPIVLE